MIKVENGKVSLSLKESQFEDDDEENSDDEKGSDDEQDVKELMKDVVESDEEAENSEEEDAPWAKARKIQGTNEF